MSQSCPRRWFAVDCAAHHSPPLARLRAAAGPLADVYYYRAVAFCKLYAPRGELELCWRDLATSILWPDDSSDLRDLFRATGIVVPPRDRLYLWQETNGWIIRQRAEDAAWHRNQRAQAKRHASAERKRRALARAPKSLLSVGRSVGRCADVGRRRPTQENPKKERGKQ